MQAANQDSNRTHLSRRPARVAAALLLGFMAGSVCGWNLTFACLTALTLALNVRLSVAACAAGCGAAMAALGAPALNAVGKILLDQLQFGPLISELAPGPLGAMFRLDDYQVFGGLVTSLVVGVPTAHAAAMFVAGREASRTANPTGADRRGLLRPHGALSACCCLAAAACGAQFQGERLATEAFLQQASLALDTELTADGISYGLWNGALKIDNLRVGDAAAPGRTALLIESVEARCNPSLFLRGRLHCTEVKLAGLLSDASARKSLERVGVFATTPTVLKEDVPQTSHNDDPSRAVEVQSLVRSWSKLGERTPALQKLVALVERVADLEAPGSSLNVREGRAAAGRRCLSAAPLVEIKRVVVERLPTAWRLSANTTVELTHLSSRAATAEHAPTLICEDPTHAVACSIGFHFDGAERKHDLALSIDDVAADELLSGTALRGGLETSSARFTSITGSGWATRDQIELQLNAAAKNLLVASSVGTVAGVDAELWRQALAHLGEFRLDAKAAGRWSQLTLSLVPAAAVEHLKHQLRAAGAHDLVKAVDAPRSTKPLAAPTAVAAAPAAAAAATPPLAVNAPPAADAAAKLPPATPNTLPAATPKSDVAKNDVTKSDDVKGPLGPQSVYPMTDTPGSPLVAALAAAAATPVATTPKTDAVAVAKPIETAAAPSTTTPSAAAPANATAATATTPAAATPAPTMKDLAAQLAVASATAMNGASAKPAAPQAETTKADAGPTDVAKSGGDSTNKPANKTGDATTTVAAQATAAATRPELPRSAARSRPAIGVASDSDLVQSDVEVAAKPAAVASTIPSRLPVDELRQPLSVLNPSARPGPVNLSVGYTEDRGPDYADFAAPEARALTPRSPRASAADVERPQAHALPPYWPMPRSELPKTTPSDKVEEREPVELAENPETTPTTKRRSFALPDRPGNPATTSKSPATKSAGGKTGGGVFGKLGLFGGGGGADKAPQELPLESSQPIIIEEEPAAPAPSKKMFPKIRAFFFPDDEAEFEAEASAQYEASPDVDARGEGVRRSSFSESTPTRGATTADYTQGRPLANMPRELVDEESSTAPRAERAGTPYAGASDSAEPKKMSARESFYNRVVR